MNFSPLADDLPHPFANSALLMEAVTLGQTLLVDVRTGEEFREGHLPGAQHIPLAELGNGHHSLPKDRILVLYCAHGIRSRLGVQALRELGYPKVYNFGGIHEWQGPLVTGEDNIRDGLPPAPCVD